MLTAATSCRLMGRDQLTIGEQLGYLLGGLTGLRAGHLCEAGRGGLVDLASLLFSLLDDPAGHFPLGGQGKTLEAEAGFPDPFDKPVLVIVLLLPGLIAIAALQVDVLDDDELRGGRDLFDELEELLAGLGGGVARQMGWRA